MSERNDLVEELRQVGWDAVDEADLVTEDGEIGVGYKALPTFIRAVLSYLARRGVEEPEDSGLNLAIKWAEKRIAAECPEICRNYEPAFRDGYAEGRVSIAPLLAARDAALAEARAALIQATRNEADTAADNERLREALAGSEASRKAADGMVDRRQNVIVALERRAKAAEKRLAAVLALDADWLEEAIRAGEERAAEQGRAKGKPIWQSHIRTASVAEVLALIRSRAGTQEDPPISDPAERAKAVAKELRWRGLWAKEMNEDEEGMVRVAHPVGLPGVYTVAGPKMAALGPCGIADAIQHEEARRAKKWGGDE